MNGIFRYTVEMRSPLGPRPGALELEVCEERINGTLTLFQQTHPIRSGRHTGSSISFSGMIQTLLYPLLYTADGQFSGEGIHLTLHTEKGSFGLTGTAITGEEGAHGKR